MTDRKLRRREFTITGEGLNLAKDHKPTYRNQKFVCSCGEDTYPCSAMKEYVTSTMTEVPPEEISPEMQASMDRIDRELRGL